MVTPNNNSTELIPNVTRVRDASGFVGTVVYLGPVASAKSTSEIYAGISWDDVTRESIHLTFLYFI
jgi:hypothetical protein